MITYFYWALVLFITVAVLVGFGKANQWKIAAVGSLLALLLGWVAHTFYFENLFVKRLGGVMTIKVPDGQLHISSTWKDDHLWVENYDPATNTCYFNEYSRGNLLQGKVIIKNCNPVLPVKQ